MPSISNDGRMHSAIYNKRDPRLNAIIRRYKKDDILKLYDVDCTMLMRIGTAFVDFDMYRNHRPYIKFSGGVEGVYLEPQTGLLFPNGADQLDFRTDYPVYSGVEYELSDLEIATLANNGLFNDDYVCQGEFLNNIIEIPCKIDYFAIKNTPITFIGIHDQYNIKTSTRKTGYKTLVATFLPYNMQKHNEEDQIKPMPKKADDERTAIRQRDRYQSKDIEFTSEVSDRTMLEGADFVEVAQSRIQRKLQGAMSSGDIMKTNDPRAASKDIVDTVRNIQKQTQAVRDSELNSSEYGINRVDVVNVDAKINDMANRMAYAAANSREVNVEPIGDISLTDQKPVNKNDETMVSPITKIDVTKASHDQAVDAIEQHSNDIHQNMFDTDKVADDIVAKTLSRKEKLALRKKQRQKVQEEVIKAGMMDAADRVADDNTGGHAHDKPTAKEQLDNERLKNDIVGKKDIDYDEIINSIMQ